MEKVSSQLKTFLNLLEKKEKMAAMVAPSFPIDFSPSEIVGQLKKLGFELVVEVSRGAEETNNQLLELMKRNPQARYITNPCPAIVRLVRRRYPQLERFLSPIDSPMINTAKLILEKYPGMKPVFIGPCPVKRLEAEEDYPELEILVLTFKEIKKVLEMKKISLDSEGFSMPFDLVGEKTRLYPISGGLAQSSGLIDLLTDPEYDVLSGPKLVREGLEDFEKNEEMKLLDVLFCDGGCIAGRGIASSLPTEERREKVISHWS